jgi:hypothetical protein
MGPTLTRRGFLRRLAAGVLIVPGVADRQRASPPAPASSHPDPRPGIDASHVLSADQLRSDGFGDDVVEVFDMVREMPGVADGLACYCGCALLGNRSLLTCYHAGGMARGCQICQGEARLAYRRWKEGQSLDQIRRAIDARWAT